ncbi:MAG: nucleotidyltransferase family protein [Opitutaceae bacterium]
MNEPADSRGGAAGGGTAGPAERWGAIVLAAGASLRMGRAKQLIEIDGLPLVARAAGAALEGGLWPVIVVVGANAAQVRPVLARLPVLIVENAAWPEGMASSLRAGVGALVQFSRSTDGVLAALCDQPGFTAATVGSLRAAQTASGRGIAAARYAGRIGAPALFGRRYYSALAALTGEKGARTLLLASIDDVVAVDLPELAPDLDTPADLASFSRARGGRTDPRPPAA